MTPSDDAPDRTPDLPEPDWLGSDAPFRSLFDVVDKALCVVEPVQGRSAAIDDFRCLLGNPAFRRQVGQSDVIGRTLGELAPAMAQQIGDGCAEVARSGQSRRIDVHRPDLDRWVEVEACPTDTPGRIVLLFGDVTRRQRAEEALREREQRLRTLVQGVPQLVWRAHAPGRWAWASEQWTEFTGQSSADSEELGWLEPVHPEDRDGVMRNWARAEAEDGFEATFRLLHSREGRYRWVQTRATPVHDAAGQVVEWLGTSTDVDDLRRLQDRQQLLVAELQHRVRNILTVVRSVFARTVDAGGSTEELSDHFKGRLDALARTQVIVTQSNSGMVNLEDLIRDELLSVGVSDGPQVRIDGPDVVLTPRIATSLGLAIHELTTNSLKYGALRIDDATLMIRWAINLDYGEQHQLVLTWTEQGVPAIPVTPGRRGFGTELIEEALPYRLGAEARIEFRGGGVRCTIAVPLPDEATDTAEMWKDR